MEKTEKKTVLVVDDEVLIRELLKDILERCDCYEPLICESGEHATMLIHKADVLITDLQMQGMNSAELTERAKIQKPDIPVMIMSGATETIPWNHRADKVIAKPFKIDEIISWLREVTMK